MKLSVSLPVEDVTVLDEQARRLGLPSRSAVVHQAIHLLQRLDLEDDYAAAWEQWDTSGDREAWEGVTGDGLS